MTPKEKAKELYNKLNPHTLTINFYGENVEVESTKLCALIAVTEIINALDFNFENPSEDTIYWLKVKQEIEKL